VKDKVGQDKDLWLVLKIIRGQEGLAQRKKKGGQVS